MVHYGVDGTDAGTSAFYSFLQAALLRLLPELRSAVPEKFSMGPSCTGVAVTGTGEKFWGEEPFTETAGGLCGPLLRRHRRTGGVASSGPGGPHLEN